MKESKIYITAFIISFIICFIASGLLLKKCQNQPKVIKTDTITITDTFWKDTTIIEKEFVPKEVIKKKVDTLYLQNGDTLNLITESKRYERSLVSDKDTCDLKIYTSGINTNLDSLKWRLKTHSVTNTIEITKYVERKKRFKDRFHIQPQAGVGYGLISKKVDAFVGVGLGIDIW